MFLSLSASRSRCLTEFNSASVCIHFGPARPVKSRIGECLAPAAEMCCRSLCSLAEISGTDISEGKLPLHPRAMGRLAAGVGSMSVLSTPAASPFAPLGFCAPGDGTRSLFECESLKRISSLSSLELVKL